MLLKYLIICFIIAYAFLAVFSFAFKLSVKIVKLAIKIALFILCPIFIIGSLVLHVFASTWFLILAFLAILLAFGAILK